MIQSQFSFGKYFCQIIVHSIVHFPSKLWILLYFNPCNISYKCEICIFLCKPPNTVPRYRMNEDGRRYSFSKLRTRASKLLSAVIGTTPSAIVINYLATPRCIDIAKYAGYTYGSLSSSTPSANANVCLSPAMKTTDILILFWCVRTWLKSSIWAWNWTVTGGTSKGSCCGGSDCGSFLSLKALSCCLSCVPLLSNNLEDAVLPGGVVQGCMFPGGWVNIEGSQRCLQGVFEAISLITM